MKHFSSKDLDINSSYELSDKQIQSFKTNGFIKLQDVLSADVLDHYGMEITHKVLELNALNIPMNERDTYQKAFLQVTNLWRQSELVKEFVFSKRLGKIAADLLEVNGVRMYHDQALYKEPQGGFTPWHVDQYYWPLASEKTCTVWIPLQRTSLEMGPLYFAAKSHQFSKGRELKISDESEEKIKAALAAAEFEIIQEPFELGEVSFHYGWTFHRAGPNITPLPRRVMTIIYMDKEMRLKAPENENQQIDSDAFCPGVQPGELIKTELNPILYER